jgi:hypothetical protein
MQSRATACRLAHVIPDYAEQSAYSGTLTSGIYNEAGQTMPNLILMMAFGDSKLATHIKGYLDELVSAKELFTSDDQKMIDHIVDKDRGPLLFWLANERIPASLPSCPHRSSLPACLLPNCKTPSPYPTRPR